MDERRTLRVSEALREELCEIIGFETEDPRLLAVEVTEAHVSSDGRHANVKVAVRGPESEQKASLAALENARHYLRHEAGWPAEPPACSGAALPGTTGTPAPKGVSNSF